MSPDTKKHYWLYTLLLEQGKCYIGITTRKDPNTRIREHMNRFVAAKWTKKFRPIASLERPIDLGVITKQEAQRLETVHTLHYMDIYGYKNVRGGDYAYSGVYIKLFSKLITEEVVELSVVFVILIILMGVILFRKG
jgi:predicted GIY-YIG superfamily endonuclease